MCKLQSKAATLLLVININLCREPSHISRQCHWTLGSFHIHYIISFLSRENMNSQLTSLPMCGFIAQLVEHRTGIAEVTASNPVEALIFFRLLYSNCLHWKFTAKITYHLHIYHCYYCECPSTETIFNAVWVVIYVKYDLPEWTSQKWKLFLKSTIFKLFTHVITIIKSLLSIY